MRSTILGALCGAFFVAGCSTDRATAPRSLPRAHFAVDFTQPAAPTGLSATVASKQGHRITLTVAWTDNSTFADEWATCFTFTPVGGGTQCAYASDYGAGTGARTATVIVPKGTWSMAARTSRAVALSDPLVGDYTITVRSEWSAPVTVEAR
jgi:hypothetical protein